MVELHDALAVPRAMCGRAGIAVHEDDVMTAPGERDAGEESGWSGADDDRMHQSHLLR
jgi:hypothetical protein